MSDNSNDCEKAADEAITKLLATATPTQKQLINKYITDLLLSNVKSPNRPRYTCCITGPIGVGKTTTVNEIIKFINEKYPDQLHIIREYIDGRMKRTSGELLTEYLQGKLTDPSFQNYIQSYYLDELKNPILANKIVIMERCMSDSVAIFCNNANRKYGTWLPGKKNFEDIDFTIMYNVCIQADEIAGVPNYFKKNFQFSRIVTENIMGTVDKIKEIITNDIATGVTNRVIGLCNTPEICFDRIKIRSRDGETSYTQEDIDVNTNAYEKLYNLIEDPEYKEIRVFDLGILFHK